MGGLGQIQATKRTAWLVHFWEWTYNRAGLSKGQSKLVRELGEEEKTKQTPQS